MLRMLRMVWMAVLVLPQLVGQEPDIFVTGTGNAQMTRIECGGAGRWCAYASSFADSSISVLDLSTGNVVKRLASGAGTALNTANPVQDQVAVVEGANPLVPGTPGVAQSEVKVAVYDVRSGKELWKWTAPPGPSKAMTTATVRFTSDGTRLEGIVSVTPQSRFRMPKSESKLFVWDAAKGDVLESRSLPEGMATFSSDGGWLCSYRWSGMRGEQGWRIEERSNGKPVGVEFKGGQPQALDSQAPAASPYPVRCGCCRC